MKAFFATEVSKPELIAVLKEHYAADRIVQGTYWQGNGDGRGCAVGCSLHTWRPGRESEHSLYEELFGVPAILAGMEDRIFEGLPEAKAREWPLRFVRAITEGADLSRVAPAVLYRVVERRRDGLDGLTFEGENADELRAVIEQARLVSAAALALLAKWRDTGVMDKSAADSVRSAVDSVRSAAASVRSAAASVRSAAASVRYAVDSVRYAVDSVGYAVDSVRSAAASVRSAADSVGYVEYEWIADTLIEEIERAGALA